MTLRSASLSNDTFSKAAKADFMTQKASCAANTAQKIVQNDRSILQLPRLSARDINVSPCLGVAGFDTTALDIDVGPGNVVTFEPDSVVAAIANVDLAGANITPVTTAEVNARSFGTTHSHI
jgi:hypothetical protein